MKKKQVICYKVNSRNTDLIDLCCICIWSEYLTKKLPLKFGKYICLQLCQVQKTKSVPCRVESHCSALWGPGGGGWKEVITTSPSYSTDESKIAMYFRSFLKE